MWAAVVVFSTGYPTLIAGKRRYSVKLWKTFTDCFNCLPVAAIVDDKIFCCHGGLSPDLHDFEQVKEIARPTDVPDTGVCLVGGGGGGGLPQCCCATYMHMWQ